MDHEFSVADNRFMSRALELALQGRFTTAPDPNVGCIIVNQNNIVGEGFHLRAGELRAEIHALTAAGQNAQGASCYVTLEPCLHDDHTRDCIAALIHAEVKEVVIAMLDPNPQFTGQGVALLTAAGVKVRVGLLASQAYALNPGFICRMKTQRPWVRLKMAASLDGRTALANGESKWITSAAARSDVQIYRAQASAIVSTASTVLMDNASLNVRYNELGQSQFDYPLLSPDAVRQPLRVIIDNHRRLDKYLDDPTVSLKLFAQPGPILLVNGNKTDVINKRSLKVNEFVSRIEIERDCHHNIDLNQLMIRLAQQDINDIWVEAGATLAGALLENKLVDELIIYLAPKLMGGNARSLAVLSELTSMAQVPTFSFTDITLVGDDLRITAKPEY